jgi:hypothetical protein
MYMQSACPVYGFASGSFFSIVDGLIFFRKSAGRPAAGPCAHRTGRLSALGHHQILWCTGGPRAARHHAQVLRSSQVRRVARQQLSRASIADSAPHTPAVPCTFDRYHLAISRGMLGWLVNCRNVPLEEVSLRHAIPLHQREVMTVKIYLMLDAGIHIVDDDIPGANQAFCRNGQLCRSLAWRCLLSSAGHSCGFRLHAVAAE